jgi:hypothetical protein
MPTLVRDEGWGDPGRISCSALRFCQSNTCIGESSPYWSANLANLVLKTFCENWPHPTYLARTFFS